MDIDALKQKVLDLAIRGKLVPQDPNDEPASVLIEKIRVEKEQLVKEGKIKPSKDESFIYKGSDNCYYEKTIKLGDAIDYIQPNNYIVKSTDYDDSYKTPVLTPGKSFILGYTNETDGIYDASQDNVIIFDDFTTATKYVDFKFKVKSSAMKILVSKNKKEFNIKYFYYLMNTITIFVDSHKRFWISEYQPLEITIPPYWYQELVVDYLDVLFYKLELIDKENKKLEEYVELSKKKILDSIFGENSSYKSYYENEYTLGELLPYEQPGPYIVKSTDYDDLFRTPVITPGKSFILGYTAENDGIYSVGNSKVIVFDDFTTSSRLIDFNFKVKSSAMKILKTSNSHMFNIDYLYYLLQTLYVNNDTHKRYWISEYAPLRVKVHQYEEQLQIINYINDAYKILDSINRI